MYANSFPFFHSCLIDWCHITFLFLYCFLCSKYVPVNLCKIHFTVLNYSIFHNSLPHFNIKLTKFNFLYQQVVSPNNIVFNLLKQCLTLSLVNRKNMIRAEIPLEMISQIFERLIINETNEYFVPIYNGLEKKSYFFL